MRERVGGFLLFVYMKNKLRIMECIGIFQIDKL